MGQLNNNEYCIRLLPNSIEELACLFPIGSAVTVYVRRIPAHQFSQLKYQAVYLTNGIYNNLAPLESFLNDIGGGSLEQINAILVDLDIQYDLFKQNSRLHMVKSNDIHPVPVCLNCLPLGWEAVVKSGIDEENGLIEISNINGKELHVPGQEISVSRLYAIFHITDVVFSANFSGIMKQHMGSIVGRKVDLRARNVTMCERPSELIVEARSRLERQQPVRTLQAIQVFVRSCKEERIPKDVPRPTILRAAPGSFNFSSKSAFFCNSTLRQNLDDKVADYLKTREGNTPAAALIRSFYENILANPIAVGTLRYAKGRVVRVLSNDYAIATLYLEKHEKAVGHSEVLFDIYDLWVGAKVCADAGISLKDLLTPGDYIKLLCIPVDRQEEGGKCSSDWKLQYLATSVVTSRDEESLSNVVLPSSEVYRGEDVSQEKLENFKTVANLVELTKVTSAEKIIMQEVGFCLLHGSVETSGQQVESENLVVGKLGCVVLLINDEFGVISFKKKVDNDSETDAYALFQRQSVYRNISDVNITGMSNGKMTLFLKTGMQVCFNAFRVTELPRTQPEMRLVQFYASSISFGNLLANKLHDTHLYFEKEKLCFSHKHSPAIFCKGFVSNGFQELKIFFLSDQIGRDLFVSLSQKYQSQLEKCHGNIIYKGEDFCIVQIKTSERIVYGMHLETVERTGSGYPVASNIMVDARLIDPCGGVQYLISRIHQVKKFKSIQEQHNHMLHF